MYVLSAIDYREFSIVPPRLPLLPWVEVERVWTTKLKYLVAEKQATASGLDIGERFGVSTSGLGGRGVAPVFWVGPIHLVLASVQNQ